MTSPENATLRLEELSVLQDGWQFGEGKAIKSWSVNATRKYIDFATKAKITEMEVFPRLDGGIELNLYQGERTLEIASLPDRSFICRIETAENPLIRVQGLAFKDIFDQILRFVTWSSTASSILITGTTANSGIIGRLSPSREKTQESPSQPKNALTHTPKRMVKKSAQEFTDTTAPTPKTNSLFFGSWNSESSGMELEYATASPQQETYAITTW